MADGWTHRSNKDRYLRRLARLERMARHYGAQTRTRGSGGRTEGDNVIILRANAKKGREVMGVSAQERKKGQAIWDRATSLFLRSGHESHLVKAAEQIGKLLVEAYQRRIRRGTNADGTPFTPLKDSTKRTKKEQTGRDDLPPMMRTGELMRSFLFKVFKR